MADITKYVLVSREGHEEGGYFDRFDEAKAAAARSDCAVHAHIYIYDDNDLVWTPDGPPHIWPMPGGTR